MKKNKDCYFCGAKSNGVEHVPAKQLFVGFNADAVTVPSCDLHNGSKSHKDDAIVKGLLKSLQTTSPKHNLHAHVIKAINNAKDNFGRVKALVKTETMVKGESKGVFAQEMAWIHDSAQIHMWMIQITAGWVWDALKKFDGHNNWADAEAYSYDYLKKRDDESFTKEQLIKIVTENHNAREALLSESWTNGWSAYPRPYPETIYLFKFLIRDNKILFQHRFFNGSYIWFVEIEPSKETDEIFRLIQAKKYKDHL